MLFTAGSSIRFGWIVQGPWSGFHLATLFWFHTTTPARAAIIGSRTYGSRTNVSEYRFLQATEPVDILLCRNQGRLTGEAYVVFGTYEELQIALARNKTYMGQRYVEVFQARKMVCLGP